MQLECHSTVAIDGVVMVHNLEPKFFGGNGGGYCVCHILQGTFPCSI
jgi:hypothetical protein